LKIIIHIVKKSIDTHYAFRLDGRCLHIEDTCIYAALVRYFYSCVHNSIVTFGLLGRQSVTLNIGLNIGFSDNRNNRPSEQSAKCNIGQALIMMLRRRFLWSPQAVIYDFRNS